jgi:hypothetical protein
MEAELIKIKRMIPKKIFQTHKDYNLSEEHQKLIHNIISVNSDFEYTFMDNDQCYEFIETNFEKRIVDMYNSLPLDIMRADFWRIAVIYVNGGIYSDCDVLCLKELSPLIDKQELVLFSEKNDRISNFFFASVPKHPVLKKTIDLMIEWFESGLYLNSELLVQDFGMAPLHNVAIEEVNKIKLPYLKSMEWVLHYCDRSWELSEKQYKIKSKSLKPITFFTTFHQNGFELYGKLWIDTIIKNVLLSNPHINVIVYSQNVKDLNIDHPRVSIIDFDTAIPQHTKWVENFHSLSNHSEHVKNFIVRFSHKGFVIQHALQNIKNGYGIWMDADVMFKKSEYFNFPDLLFNNGEVLCCQVEDDNHVETGILIFDMENSKLKLFTESYIKNYSIDEIVLNLGEAYDGHITKKSLDMSGIKYLNLNQETGYKGIQSDPNRTFRHKDIHSRFTHNIGITGKRNYGDWNQIKTKDNIFTILETGIFRPISEELRQVVKLRSKRYRT